MDAYEEWPTAEAASEQLRLPVFVPCSTLVHLPFYVFCAMSASVDRSALVLVDKSHDEGRIWVVKLNRPSVRNAVDFWTAKALSNAFSSFERCKIARVAILTGEGGNFCAGADLKGMASGSGVNALTDVVEVAQEASGAVFDTTGPMGVSRMVLSKPVIAAVSGYAVAGGLELSCWCDMRVADETAVFGVFCRRFGVPLIDGGTVRLPLLIGHSRAMDMILTGRAVSAREALSFGLVNRLVDSSTPAASPPGQPAVLLEAIALAKEIANFPQLCMRSDRLSAIHSSGKELRQALQHEFQYGVASVTKGGLDGAKQFAAGVGRHGVQQQPIRAKL